MGQMIEKGNTQKRKPILTIIIEYIYIYIYMYIYMNSLLVRGYKLKQ